MWREIATVGLGFGAIWLGATFGIPLAFAGGALTFWGKPGTQELAWCMVAGAVVSTVLLVASYVQTVDRCKQWERYQTPTIAEQIFGQQIVQPEDLEYVKDGCADLPFA